MPNRELDLTSLITTATVTGLDVSPDGRFICFGSTAGGVSQIYVQSLDGGDPLQVTRGRDGATQPKWSPRGDMIAYLQDVGGDENYQVYVMDPRGGTARNVTNSPGKLHENLAWSWDGSRIAYISNRDGQFDVYFSDVATGEVHRVTDYPAVHHGPQFSPGGTHIAFGSNRSDHPNNWDTFTVSLVDGYGRKVTAHEGEADEMSYYANQSPRWSPDGRRMLVASSVPGNYDIMAIDDETLEREWIADSPWDESNAQWSPDGNRIAYVRNEDGNLVIYVRDVADERTWPVSQREGVAGYVYLRGKGSDYRWAPDSRHLIYGYSGPAEADSIWVVSAEGGEPRCLFASMPSEIDRSLLVRPEIVHYSSFDGRQISAFLYRPMGIEGIVPAIVIPHGGPTHQTLNRFDPTVQYLANRGFAVLAPNFRGSTGYGTEFQWLNRYDWGGGDLKDVVAGADWLEEQGISDRIGITGGSYGGYMTLSAITKFPSRWKAAVSVVGIANLITTYQAAREDQRQFQVRNLGTPDKNPELYYDRSPINFVENVTTPLLILQGERDPRVKLEEAVQMRDRLQALGREHELVVYEYEGHGFFRHENRIDALRRTAEFFAKHLAGVPATT